MARFERLPSHDVRQCFGCGDDGATEAWVDHSDGNIFFAARGWQPTESQRDLFDRQCELPLDAIPRDHKIVSYGPW